MSRRRTNYICEFGETCFECPLDDCVLPGTECVNTNVMDVDIERTYNNEWRDKE